MVVYTKTTKEKTCNHLTIATFTDKKIIINYQVSKFAPTYFKLLAIIFTKLKQDEIADKFN